MCYLFYYMFQFFFTVVVWDLQHFLVVLWGKAIKVGLSGFPSILRRSPGWHPEPEEPCMG